MIRYSNATGTSERWFSRMHDLRLSWQRIVTPLSLSLSLSVAVACADLNGNERIPAGTVDPNSIKNAEGAAGMYFEAYSKFQGAFASYIVISGMLGDELQSNSRGSRGKANEVLVDARMLQSSAGANSEVIYDKLHLVRVLTNQAIGALAKYDPERSENRRAHLYALKAYAEIYLADLFCSGVPLSTYDFEKDFTYHPSSSTDAVYRHAIALFDTALTLGADSIPVVSLASIGKGRALLALGKTDSAAMAVQSIPTSFRYDVLMFACGITNTICEDNDDGNKFRLTHSASVVDHEGNNGQLYISSNDPRSASHYIGDNPFTGSPTYFPDKYTPDGISAMSVADGIEAQLILAEAALEQGLPEWLPILNQLRTTCTTAASCPTPAPAGTGGIEGLPPLEDPGRDTARVTVLFRERAYWLFVSGRRQGDMRRLVRQYDRAKGEVYPVGAYPIVGNYGNSIDLPIPSAEFANPLFEGCVHRD